MAALHWVFYDTNPIIAFLVAFMKLKNNKRENCLHLIAIFIILAPFQRALCVYVSLHVSQKVLIRLR